jgi:hypothetical protein
MFKEINGRLININNINEIEDIGIDEKDGKQYSRIFLVGGDPTGILIEGTLKEVQEFLNK